MKISVSKKAQKAPLPETIKPMLCTLIQGPFTKPGWLFEIKWDGYRIIAFKQKNKLILRSRSGLDYPDRYPAIVSSLKKIKSDFVLDGEIVAFDESGNISFDAVQKANPDAPLTYYAFDLLWVNAYNITQLPLIDRKEILKSLIPAHGIIKFSDHFTDGLALYEEAQQLELEGVVAKKADSTYEPGKRGYDWLKIPTVSTPLDWKEVKDTLDPHQFTIKTILKRFEKKGDTWSGLFEKKLQVNNSKILKQFL